MCSGVRKTRHRGKSREAKQVKTRPSGIERNLLAIIAGAEPRARHTLACALPLSFILHPREVTFVEQSWNLGLLPTKQITLTGCLPTHLGLPNIN